MIIKLTGWQDSFQKISFTKLQMEYFQLSLKDAKTNTDTILEGGTISLELESIEEMEDFIQKARAIGIIYDGPE